MAVRGLLAELAALIAAPACATCRAPLTAAGEAMCGACRRELPWLRGPLCPRCALPAPCRPCPAAGAPFDAAWAPMAYAGAARRAVAALKFSGAVALADVMAAQMAATAPPHLIADVRLVPVPLPAGRRRARGFNQSRRLACALGARLSLPVADCLRRRGPATRQLGAGRGARRRPGRLEVIASGAIPDRAALVDDVHTTGATLAACAAALRAAGARHVACLTYARTL